MTKVKILFPTIFALIFGILFFTACDEKPDNNSGEVDSDTTAVAAIDTGESKEEVEKEEMLLKIVSQLPENQWTSPYELPELGYAYDALQPVIDAKTMEVHHSKHHKGYTKKTNAAIEENKLSEVPLVQLFARMNNYPDAVRNNGGGYYNHNLFWTFLIPGGSDFQGDIAEAIKAEFGSLEAFQSEFEKAAATQFGSGWAWLILTPEGKLAVTNTANQDNPLMSTTEQNGIPLLNLDVWEHAYYLKYQNKRGDYIKSFWDILNWKEVNERYKTAMSVIEQK